MRRKQPLGLAKRGREREGERKKWCDVMTRWTPGARQDTPGFIGLGTLLGPRYTVCVYACPPLDTSITNTCTSNGFLSSGEPTPHSYWCCYSNRKTNTGVAWDVDPLQSGKVYYSAFLLLSSSVLQWSSEQYAAVIHDKGQACRHAQDTMMCASMFGYSAEYWFAVILWSSSMHRQDKTTQSLHFSLLSCWSVPLGYCGTFYSVSPKAHVYKLCCKYISI